MAEPEQTFEEKVMFAVVKEEELENWDDVRHIIKPVVLKQEHGVKISPGSDEEHTNQSIPFHLFGTDDTIAPNTKNCYPKDTTRQCGPSKQMTVGSIARRVKVELLGETVPGSSPEVLHGKLDSDVDLLIYQKPSQKHLQLSRDRSCKDNSNVNVKSSTPRKIMQKSKSRRKKNSSKTVEDWKVSVDKTVIYNCKRGRPARKSSRQNTRVSSTEDTSLLEQSCIQTFIPRTIHHSKRYCSYFTQLRQTKPERHTLIGFDARCKVTLNKRCNVHSYSCVTCKKKFSLYSKFVRHYSQKHLERAKTKSASYPRTNQITVRYKCRLCQRPFVHRSVLMQHLTVVHSGIFPVEELSSLQIKPKQHRLSCAEDGCQFICYNRTVLLTHVTKVHPLVMYNCPDCKCHYRLQDELKQHRKEFHSDAEAVASKNKCFLCGKHFKKPYLLKTHMFSRHKVELPSLKLFSCGVGNCNYKSAHKQGLKQHMQKHQTDKLFSCDECGKKVKTQRNLERHISKMHLNIRPFMCEHCGMSFGDESELKAHVLRHSDFKQFICEHCSYETHEKTTFKIHLYACHGVKMDDTLKIFSCTLCEFKTARKSHFASHMKVHLQIRDLPCPKCDKVFMTHNALHSHLQKVHRPKDYKCDYCMYAATNKSCLKQHIRVMHTHRDYKPFKCGYCEFHSAIRGNCRKHVIQKHRGQEVMVIHDGDASMVD